MQHLSFRHRIAASVTRYRSPYMSNQRALKNYIFIFQRIRDCVKKMAPIASCKLRDLGE
ncbi:MAG: hypothetical protein AB7D07_01400 [Desulfovibrionaceae bacterium]